MIFCIRDKEDNGQEEGREYAHHNCGNIPVDNPFSKTAKEKKINGVPNHIPGSTQPSPLWIQDVT